MISEMEVILNKNYHSVSFEGTIQDFFVSKFLKEETSIIGVEGASASGKTIFTKDLTSAFPIGTAVSISLDDYLVMSNEEMKSKGIETRYDWRTRDRDAFLSDIKILRSGSSVIKQKQDFLLEQPSQETEVVVPAKFIIIEGNLDIADVCDTVIFLFASDAILTQRRFDRDKQKAIHANQEQLMQAIHKSLNFYRSLLEPHAEKAKFIFDTGTKKLYERN